MSDCTMASGTRPPARPANCERSRRPSAPALMLWSTLPVVYCRQLVLKPNSPSTTATKTRRPPHRSCTSTSRFRSWSAKRTSWTWDRLPRSGIQLKVRELIAISLASLTTFDHKLIWSSLNWILIAILLLSRSTAQCSAEGSEVPLLAWSTWRSTTRTPWWTRWLRQPSPTSKSGSQPSFRSQRFAAS